MNAQEKVEKLLRDAKITKYSVAYGLQNKVLVADS